MTCSRPINSQGAQVELNLEFQMPQPLPSPFTTKANTGFTCQPQCHQSASVWKAMGARPSLRLHYNCPVELRSHGGYRVSQLLMF